MAQISDQDAVNGRLRVLGMVPSGVYSGAETVLVRDLAAAHDAGWRVRIACSDGPMVAQLERFGIERLAIPELRLPGGARLVGFGRAAVSAIRTHRIVAPTLAANEVIVANGLNVLPALRRIARNHPVAYYAHDVLVRADRIALLRASSRSVAVALAVSHAVATPLRELGVTTEVVYNGTTWPVEPAPEPDPSVPPIIGIAALLTPWKGHATLLEAFARIARRDAILEIMGGTLPKDQDYAQTLRDRAEQPDLAGRVRFLGHVTDPVARMRTWTLAVSASIDPEAGPLTTLEAMSVGVPLVVTAHGGVLEVLDDAGIAVAPRDPAALAAGIDRLLGDDALRARCRVAGPQAIIDQRLTQTDHQERFLNILRRTAAGHTHRRR